jgi:hypothetical protein
VAVILSFNISITAQNLVPNPSFEIVECQTATFFPFGCTVANNPPWVQPGTGSSDSFNSCHTGDFGSFLVPNNFQGNQLPMSGSGNGYAGVMTYEDMGIEYREYIQVALSSPLLADVTYDLSFYCSLADNSTFASDGLGMLLTNNMVFGAGQGLITGTPQLTAGVISDSDNWTLVSGTYTAAGGESYLTIGNFLSDAQTTTVASGQGSFERAFYYVDEVAVTGPNETGLADFNLNRIQLKVHPNPSADYLSIPLDISTLERFQIFDVLGKEMTSEIGIISSSAESTTIDISALNAGIFTLITDQHTGSFLKTED